MDLKIEKSFETKSSFEQNWALLSNIDKVVQCLPGAGISEKKNDKEFLGFMVIKMGPMNLKLDGVATINEMSAEKKQMSITGKAKDTKGAGETSLLLTLNLTGDAECTFNCKAEITVNGKMVQYGGRLIQSATNSVFDKFMANYKLMLSGSEDKMEKSLGVGSIIKGMVSGLMTKN